MMLALTTLAAAIPDFNRRSLTEADFHSIAEEHRITVAYDHMPELIGFCARAGGRDLIFLDASLRGVKLRFAAFHELSHSLLHIPRNEEAAAMFYHHRRPSVEDAEADACALILLYPKTDLAELRDRIRTTDPFEERLIRQRLAIFQQFGE